MITRRGFLTAGMAAAAWPELPAAAQGRVPFVQKPAPGDSAALSWMDAFDALHKKLSTEYAFTEWRRVDWPGLHARYSPRIVEAQANGDFEAYYVALREYVWSIPDGHLSVTGPASIRAKYVGGGYGFAAAPLDDDRVIAHVLLPDGPAAKAGMQRGAVIQLVNGRPVREAVAATSVLWTGAPPATAVNRLHEQFRYLTRGPVGSTMRVAYRNPGAARNEEAVLTAVDDAGETLGRTSPTREPFDPAKLVRHRMLDGGIGYLWLRAEMGTALRDMTAALREFMEAGARGLIVDLRANVGGDDSMAAAMSGFFHDKPVFYEYALYYNPKTGTFDIVTTTRLVVQPREPRVTVPVIALIGPGTGSSGEGVAWMIQRARNGRTMGFSGTNGSFGMAGQTARMPGDVVVRWPHGASVDEHGRVQLDSDHSGRGGVQPDIRMPRTYETVMRLGAGEDPLLDAAVNRLWKGR